MKIQIELSEDDLKILQDIEVGTYVRVDKYNIPPYEVVIERISLGLPYEDRVKAVETLFKQLKRAPNDS